MKRLAEPEDIGWAVRFLASKIRAGMFMGRRQGPSPPGPGTHDEGSIDDRTPTGREPMTVGNPPLHESALVGWRAKVGEVLAGPVSRRTALSADQVRLALAAIFFVSSVFYVVATIRRAVRDQTSLGGA